MLTLRLMLWMKRYVEVEVDVAVDVDVDVDVDNAVEIRSQESTLISTLEEQGMYALPSRRRRTG